LFCSSFIIVTYRLSSHAARITIPRIIATKAATGIHSGAITHHQLHAIYPVSFNVIKIKHRILKNGNETVTLVLFDIKILLIS